jgi:hypothetical protein
MYEHKEIAQVVVCRESQVGVRAPRHNFFVGRSPPAQRHSAHWVHKTINYVVTLPQLSVTVIYIFLLLSNMENAYLNTTNAQIDYREMSSIFPDLREEGYKPYIHIVDGSSFYERFKRGWSGFTDDPKAIPP